MPSARNVACAVINEPCIATVDTLASENRITRTAPGAIVPSDHDSGWTGEQALAGMQPPLGSVFESETYINAGVGSDTTTLLRATAPGFETVNVNVKG